MNLLFKKRHASTCIYMFCLKEYSLTSNIFFLGNKHVTNKCSGLVTLGEMPLIPEGLDLLETDNCLTKSTWKRYKHMQIFKSFKRLGWLKSTYSLALALICIATVFSMIVIMNEVAFFCLQVVCCIPFVVYVCPSISLFFFPLIFLISCSQYFGSFWQGFWLFLAAL